MTFDNYMAIFCALCTIFVSRKCVIRTIFAMKRIVFAVLIMICCAAAVPAQSRSAVDKSTDVAMFAPAVAGGIISLVEGDRQGLWQLVGSGAASVAAAYALKYTVSKERPDGSDTHSFPSNHAGVAFMGATFLQQRYGWKYAVPAYLVGGYVAWGRVYARQHDVWDVLAGAAIGSCCSILITSPFLKEHNVAVTPVASPVAVGFSAVIGL